MFIVRIELRRLFHHPFASLTRDTEYTEADIRDRLKHPQSGRPNAETLGQMESPLWKKKNEFVFSFEGYPSKF